MSDGHDCGGDAAAYVLGALDEIEVEAFTAHMAQCVVCRDEVAELRSVSDSLAMAAPQHPAPDHLRRQIMRHVRNEPRGQGTAAARRVPALGWLVQRPVLAGGLAAVLAAVVLAAILLSSGGSGTSVYRASVGQAEVRVAGGHSELVVGKLKSTAPGHVYEVWLQRDGHPPSPTRLLFTVGADGRRTVGLPGDLHGIDAIMVTSEPAGGSQVPTSAPVIVTSLRKRA